jgi:hypothetical protein
MATLSRIELNMDEKDFPELDEESEDEDSLPNIQVVTIVFDNTTDDVPSLDLGDTSPWIAITLLQSAINTLEMLIPPVDVTYKGQVVCSSSFELLDSEDDDDC